MSLERIKKKDFESKVLKESTLVILKFTADWCSPCKMINEHLQKLINEYNGKVKFYEIDVEDDENSEIVSKYEITNLPTLLFFKNGKVINSIFGLIPYKSLKEEIEKIYRGG